MFIFAGLNSEFSAMPVQPAIQLRNRAGGVCIQSSSTNRRDWRSCFKQQTNRNTRTQDQAGWFPRA